MFGAYVYEISSAEYEKNVLLIDEDGLEEKTEYSRYFTNHGFSIIRYENDLLYRSKIEGQVKDGTEKILMIARPGTYIPYDVQKSFRTTKISTGRLFPKLNVMALKGDPELDYNLLTMAYRKNFADLTAYGATKDFLRDSVRGKANIKKYVDSLCTELKTASCEAVTYRDWFAVAEKKADIHVLAEQYGIPVDIEETCRPFIDFVLKDFGKLSAEMAEDTPVLVSRAMDYMHYHSKKFVLIVMDGMSEIDWKILSKSFDGIKYDQAHAMAMIPTVTSVSRQCLLSNKFPRELENPWSQNKEKKEFTECARSLGFADAQIGYERGYDAEFGAAGGMHPPRHRTGGPAAEGHPYREHPRDGHARRAKQGKLIGTVRRMLKAGFDVYISADHGNTLCTGMGKLMKTGVETETKSHRMVVLKDFADKSTIMEKYPGLIEYPKYYLDKQFDYLICGIGGSFDAKGEEVMNHGGITIDEVIVPFIKIKAVENNG